VQLGWGKYQQRIRATMTSKTAALAVDIAGDKDMTRQLLAAAGLPVPRGEIVRTEAEAVSAASRIGFPVVTKPLDGNHGRGVGLELRTVRDVRSGYKRALAEARRGQVVVESYVTGNDYRVLVIGGSMVAVAERIPAHVIGDGSHSVAELVEIANQDPRRGIGHEKVLTKIKVDDVAVALVKKQGYAMDDVPPEGAFVKLAATGNMSTGGISIDRTWEAHEENVEIAEEAARVVGLDVAGIDFLVPDIAQPVRETGGAIVEVNAAPGFRMHTHPTEGEPQFVAKHVVDLLFPPGTPSKIPIVAVTGSNGKTTTVRMIAHIFKGMGFHVGLTSTDGIFIDERLVKRADASGPKSAQMVLQNPRVDFAVFETARGGILREGLGYGRNDVAVVLNVTGDHLGLKGIDTIEQLAAVKQVVVEAVPKTGWAVLNADDPLVVEMRKACSGSVILFSMQEKNEIVDRWVRRGRKAVVLEKGPRGEMMVIKEGRRTMPVAWVHTLPATFEGRARMMVQNAMAAAAAAHAAGAHLHDIRQGLRSFVTSIYQAPGRLNFFDLDGVKVLIDYAHNAAGLETLGDFVERLTTDAPTGGRPGEPSWAANLRVAVVATAGDRRDEDMRELGRVAARYFDDVIVREDRSTRGRERGETAGLVLEGLEESMARGGARCGHVEVVLDEIEAARKALDRSRPGDLVVLCVDHATDVYKEIESRSALAAPTIFAQAGDGATEAGGDPDLLGG
jgi:cyanophycin synthetase